MNNNLLFLETVLFTYQEITRRSISAEWTSLKCIVTETGEHSFSASE